MSKIDEVRSAMVAAMKAGDKERKATLSALLTALKNKAIDKRTDLTEEEEVQVILKEIKQTKETIDTTPATSTSVTWWRVDESPSCHLRCISAYSCSSCVCLSRKLAANSKFWLLNIHCVVLTYWILVATVVNCTTIINYPWL